MIQGLVLSIYLLVLFITFASRNMSFISDWILESNDIANANHYQAESYLDNKILALAVLRWLIGLEARFEQSQQRTPIIHVLVCCSCTPIWQSTPSSHSDGMLQGSSALTWIICSDMRSWIHTKLFLYIRIFLRFENNRLIWVPRFRHLISILWWILHCSCLFRIYCHL